jgi:hypothetical protein
MNIILSSLFSVIKFSMGIADMFRDFANILCKGESRLFCVCVYVCVRAENLVSSCPRITLIKILKLAMRNYQFYVHSPE